MADLAKFAQLLVNQTQQEIQALLKVLKDEYGIEPAQEQRESPKSVPKITVRRFSPSAKSCLRKGRKT